MHSERIPLLSDAGSGFEVTLPRYGHPRVLATNSTDSFTIRCSEPQSQRPRKFTFTAMSAHIGTPGPTASPTQTGPHPTSATLQANKTAGDVNLVTLQICRASLVVAAIVSFVASLASGIRPYQRMANAAAAAACALSVRFYGRLIAVRRLPGNAGYRLEGNAVAEAMRVANWTVVVALLSWSAFLLRGPYDDRETQAGAILVRLTYDQWRLWGPLFMALTAVMSIPIWHLVAIAQGEQNRVTSRVASIAFALVLLAASLIFSSDVFYAIIDERHLCNSNTTICARTQEERGFATFSCWLWFGYSVIGVLRALARMSTWFSPMQQLKVQNGQVVGETVSVACRRFVL